ncbi:MAG: DUF58 domain-containing protein [Dehalococcoidia bacterium]|nr:DUF58 domain-containing protein [Dehalococcoidia bacterium]MEC8894410.1 DUF58 domain-containing protein [Candidatus Poribacteria bacterium]
MFDKTNSQHSFIDPKVLARLSGLGLHTRIPMLGSVSGRHRSPVRGSSLEFAEYRKYVPGDDIRRMDWRAWGRSDRFYIKEFEADTNLRLCLIVDTSGSLNFTVDGISKINYIKSLAGTLAYLASRQGDAVGLYCAGKNFHTEIKPKRNATHLRIVLDELAEIKAEGETGLAESLHKAAEGIDQRALVVVISDLYIEPDILNSCFQHLRFRKHDVVTFHLLDQSEVDFDFDRPTRFVDMEGGVPIMADPSLVSKQYQQAITGYLADLETVMLDAAIDYHRVNLRDPVDEILARFLVGRKPKKK